MSDQEERDDSNVIRIGSPTETTLAPFLLSSSRASEKQQPTGGAYRNTRTSTLSSSSSSTAGQHQSNYLQVPSPTRGTSCLQLSRNESRPGGGTQTISGGGGSRPFGPFRTSSLMGASSRGSKQGRGADHRSSSSSLS
ncbi:unnamed protein product, partial [Amoebophrya sp. A25]|eukprot:GSA25T00022273001.1